MVHSSAELSWAALILLPIVGLVLVGLVVGLIVLVANRKTRPWTLGFLGLAVVGLLLFVGLFASVREVRYIEGPHLQAQAIQSQIRAQAEAQKARIQAQVEADKARIRAMEAEMPELSQSEAERVFDRPPMATAPAATAHAVAPIQRTTNMSVLVLFAPIAALVILGLSAGIVYLLVNPRTRRAVLGVGGAVVGLAVVAALFILYMRLSFESRPYVVPTGYTQSRIQAEPRPQPIEVPQPVAIPQARPAADAVTNTVDMSADEAEARSLLHKVGIALGRAVAAAKAEAAKQATKEMAQVVEVSTEGAEPAAPAAARPAWLDKEPDRNAKGDFEMPIFVGPYATRNECRDALAAKLEDAVGDYAVTAIGPQARGRVHLPAAYVREHVVKDEYEEWNRFQPPLGEMVKLHVLLAFDREANAKLQEEWKHVVVSRRLYGLASVGAVLLALLATAWGYLRIDLATGGSKRGRLRLGAAVVATAVLATAVLLLG